MVFCKIINPDGKRCQGTATYGYVYGEMIRCKNHKLPDMKIVSGKNCDTENCTSKALWGINDIKSKCNIHKIEGMRLLHNACINPDCDKQCTYNYFGEKARYCKTHKLIGMVDVKHKKCKKCNTRPTYGYDDNERKPIYCKIHKDENCVDLAHDVCEYIDNGKRCTTRPCFNIKGEKYGKFCETHKSEEMVNVVDARCIHIDENNVGCTKQRYYNLVGLKPKFCSDHKTDDMIHLKGIKCEVELEDGTKCNKYRDYNYPNETIPKFCSDHKLEGMVDIRHAKCIHTDKNGNKCNKFPSYNFIGMKTNKYCSDHRQDGMIDVQVKRCKSEFCDSIIGKKYDGYCCYCFTNLFPTDPRTKDARLASKEIKTKNYLSENGHADFIHNKALYIGDCRNQRRIDLYKYIDNTHILCVEVDEYQHRGYCPNDEEQRYHDLYKLGYHMIFIRFNPDEYRDKHNKIIKTKLEDRLPRLVEEINNIINNIDKYSSLDQYLYIKYLYYNEPLDNTIDIKKPVQRKSTKKLPIENKNIKHRNCDVLLQDGTKCGKSLVRGDDGKELDMCPEHMSKNMGVEVKGICKNSYCHNKSNKNYDGYCLQCITNINPLRTGNPKDKEIIFKCTLARDNMDFINKDPIFINNIRYDIYKIINDHIIILDTKQEKSVHEQYKDYHTIYFDIRIYAKEGEKRAPKSNDIVRNFKKMFESIKNNLPNYTSKIKTFAID
jgi:hypothetical protein